MVSQATCFATAILLLITNIGVTVGQQKWLQDSQLTRAATTIAVSVDWQEAPLRQRLSELAKRQNISIFLDRRVDGSQPVSFSVINVTFEEFLWQLCDQLDLGMCRLENVYYVGPKLTAGSLPHEHELIESILQVDDEKGMRRRWSNVREFLIQELAEPRELVEHLCQAVTCEPGGLDSIPHDLWTENALVPTSAATQLTLLLAGFNKTFQPEKGLRTIAIVDAPERDEVSRTFKFADSTKALQTGIAKSFPNVNVDASNKRSLVVTGTTMDVLAVHRLMVAAQEAEVAELSEQLFTIKTAEKRGSILATIANQLERKLSYTQEQKAELSTRIELDLVDASVDELIQKTLEGTELNYRITADQLEILDR